MSVLVREPPPPPARGGQARRARWRNCAALVTPAVGLLLCVVLAIGTAGSRGLTETSRPTPAQRGGPARNGLNEPVRVKHWDLVVTAVERPGQELPWSARGDKQAAGGTWFVVVLAMTNTDTHTWEVAVQDFELRDAQGHVYMVAPGTGGISYSVFKGGQRLGGRVPPGVTVRYYLPFDIDPAAADLTFVFKQDTRPQFSVGPAQR